MRNRCIALVFVLILLVGKWAVAASDAPAPAIVSPERAGEGSILTITLDKTITDQSGIKQVRIAGQNVVTDPPVDGKLTVTVPKLDRVSREDVDVIGSDGKTVVARGQFYFDNSIATPSILGVKTAISVIFVFVLLI